MNGGAALTTLGTAPLADLVGWRWALTAWGVLVVVALAAWSRVVAARGPTGGRRGVPDPERPSDAVVPVLRRPLTWVLCAAFVGQASAYTGVMAWLPSVLHDEADLTRSGAGAAAALFQALGAVGSVLAPAALARRVPAPAVVLVVAACWLSLPVGLLVAPSGWALWSTLAGLAQGANFVLVFSAVATAGHGPAEVRQLSATVQTVGYLVAAATPSALGVLHSATAGWRAPVATLGGLLVLAAVTHLAAATRLRR